MNQRGTRTEPAPDAFGPVVRLVYQVRSDAAVWPCDDLGFVRISGPDALEWLQSQTTNDVRALAPGDGQPSAALDRKGRLQAHFSLHRWGDEYWLIPPRELVVPLLARLEAYRFLEQVSVSDESEEMGFVAVQGPRSLLRLHALTEGGGEALPAAQWAVKPCRVAGFDALAFRMSLVGVDGYLLVAERRSCDRLLSALTAAGLPIAPVEAADVVRIEAGIARWNRDMDAATRISETPLELEAVSYTKGCYIGQEVVAKLRRRGSFRRSLCGLIFDAEPPRSGSELEGDLGFAGRVCSTCWSPTLQRHVALAYLERDYRTPGRRLTLRTPGSDAEFTAEVALLPFVAAPSREDRAKELYHRALERFRQDAQDRDAAIVSLLEEALLLHPAFEDAYEVLGVVLHRQGRVDDAIAVMQQLAALNPGSVMAQTNLSVFYVAKGLIREAEEAKARSAALEMQHVRAQFDAERAAAQERARIEQEAEERLRMFKEVLEFDPDDALATYGAGMACLQLGRYEEAVPFLVRATHKQGDYSAAFLNLGKCCEFLGRQQEAMEAYRSGIAAAGRKGDLMPLREMERRLSALEPDADVP